MVLGHKIKRALTPPPVHRPKKLGIWLKDYPWAVTNWGAALLVGHAIACLHLGWLNPWGAVEREASIGMAFAAIMAGASALLAGFAGVIVMFGIQSNSSRFQRFRRIGGIALVDNWTASTTLGFLALGASVLNFVLAANGIRLGLMIAAALSVWFLVHASGRVVWLFRRLIDGVTADDHVADLEERKVSRDRLGLGASSNR